MSTKLNKATKYLPDNSVESSQASTCSSCDSSTSYETSSYDTDSSSTSFVSTTSSSTNSTYSSLSQHVQFLVPGSYDSDSIIIGQPSSNSKIQVGSSTSGSSSSSSSSENSYIQRIAAEKRLSSNSIQRQYKSLQTDQTKSNDLELETDSSREIASTLDSSDSSTSEGYDTITTFYNELSWPSSPRIYQMVSDRVRYLRKGFKHRYGDPGIEQDFSVSLSSYMQAGRMGCADSLAALAVAYIFGIGVDINYLVARKYLRQAIQQGSTDAIEIRALCWMDGIFNNQPDYVMCLDLLTIGIARHSASCLLWAGLCFEMGLGIEPDPIAANRAYMAAFTSSFIPLKAQDAYPGMLSVKDPWMLMKTALFLMHADRKPKNQLHAMNCLKVAASLGLSNAKVYLAMCLLEGKWLMRDVTAALHWIKDAAADTPPHPIAVRILDYYEHCEWLSIRNTK